MDVGQWGYHEISWDIDGYLIGYMLHGRLLNRGVKSHLISNTSSNVFQPFELPCCASNLYFSSKS